MYIQHKFDCKQSGVQCFVSCVCFPWIAVLPVTLKDGGSAENGGRNGANRRKGRASCGPYLRGCWVGLKSVSMAVGSRISFTLFAPAFSWLDAIANSLHGSSWHMLHTKCAETSYDLWINAFPTKHLYRISIWTCFKVSSTLAGNLGKYWSFIVFHQPLPMLNKITYSRNHGSHHQFALPWLPCQDLRMSFPGCWRGICLGMILTQWNIGILMNHCKQAFFTQPV